VYPDDGGDVETLMRNADGAMYHAKANGRNNYQFFKEVMTQTAARHFELESSLRGALAPTNSSCTSSPSWTSARVACTRWRCCCAGARPGSW